MRERVITTIWCDHCKGTGGTGPIRKSTGVPFSACIYCSGTGKLRRTIDRWEQPEFYSEEETAVRLAAMLRGAFAGPPTDPIPAPPKQYVEPPAPKPPKPPQTIAERGGWKGWVTHPDGSRSRQKGG